MQRVAIVRQITGCNCSHPMPIRMSSCMCCWTIVCVCLSLRNPREPTYHILAALWVMATYEMAAIRSIDKDTLSGSIRSARSRCRSNVSHIQAATVRVHLLPLTLAGLPVPMFIDVFGGRLRTWLPILRVRYYRMPRLRYYRTW